MSNLKVTIIGGVPASGKTTVMRRVIQILSKDNFVIPFQSGLVVGTYYPNGDETPVEIIGKYDTAELFAGTDKLSMAVQPQIIRYLRDKKAENVHVLFEGDRLFTASLFDALKAEKIFHRIIVLDVSRVAQLDRFKERGSTQNEIFVKGRATKITNAVKGREYVEIPNAQPNDVNSIAEALLSPAPLVIGKAMQG